jgi:putative glutamine amidotransferase
MKQPFIGITGNIYTRKGGMFPGMESDNINRDYAKCITMAGGVPVIFPVTDEEECAQRQMEAVDGLLLSGGFDVYPQAYGEQPRWELGYINPEIDDCAFRLIRAAEKMGKPIFGICKGVQLLNVFFGGTLYQDLKSQLPKSLMHSQVALRKVGTHKVEVEKDSFFGTCFPKTILTNSYHHQAIKEVAEGFRVTARCEDGVIEAIERTTGSFIAGVQWHPEAMAAQGNEEMLGMFRKFMEKTIV